MLAQFVFKSGDAKLLVRGSLLGEHQDATVLLTDFPMATLRPLFRAVPALAHAAPAVSAQRPLPVASPRPVGMLTNVLGRAGSRLDTDADSPINGLLYVSGNLSGSKDHPTGEVAVRLYDAAVGECGQTCGCMHRVSPWLTSRPTRCAAQETRGWPRPRHAHA